MDGYCYACWIYSSLLIGDHLKFQYYMSHNVTGFG